MFYSNVSFSGVKEFRGRRVLAGQTSQIKVPQWLTAIEADKNYKNLKIDVHTVGYRKYINLYGVRREDFDKQDRVFLYLSTWDDQKRPAIEMCHGHLAGLLRDDDFKIKGLARLNGEARPDGSIPAIVDSSTFRWDAGIFEGFPGDSFNVTVEVEGGKEIEYEYMVGNDLKVYRTEYKPVMVEWNEKMIRKETYEKYFKDME